MEYYIHFSSGEARMSTSIKASIGIDMGTTAIKGVLLSEEGAFLSSNKVATEYKKPSSERVDGTELEPESIYDSICTLIRKLLCNVADTAGERTIRVQGLSINGASGNTVLLDEERDPLGPVISWLDRRADKPVRELLPGLDPEDIHSVVGWPWRGSFTFAHLAWLKSYLPDMYSRAAYPAMYLEYLLWKITGLWEIDTSNATLSFLQDQERKVWHPPYCRAVNIEPSTRPRIRATGDIMGKPTAAFTEKTGLPGSISIVHGSFDHPGAARAAGVLTEKEILLSCGTSWVCFYPIGDRSSSISLGLLTDPFLSGDGGPWGGIFSLSRIGTVIEQYINALIASSAEERYERFNRLADVSAPGADGLFVNVLKEREKPVRAKTFLSRYSATAVARALMEGPAFEINARLSILSQEGRRPQRIVMVGGPAESPVWPQIIADILGLPIEIQKGQMMGAAGAALVSGYATEVLPGFAETSRLLDRKQHTVCPDSNRHAIYTEIYRKYIKTEYGGSGPSLIVE